MADENKPSDTATVAQKPVRRFAPETAPPTPQPQDDRPGVPAIAHEYGDLATASREAADHEGPVTFTVRNEEDRHQLFRLLSGSKHRKSVVIDESQEDRVTWKAFVEAT